MGEVTEGPHPMTDIDALRARMREAAVAVENAGDDLGLFSERHGEFQRLASPANVKALDAEITRLREDLDRVTRERDALLETPGGYWWPSWRKMIDAMVKPGPRCRDCADYDGRCGGDGPPCDPTEHAIENYRKSLARAEAAEAALAKRDAEVARLGRALFDLECAASSMLVGIGVHNDRHAVRTGSRIEGPVIDALARATRAAGVTLKEPATLTQEPTNAD